LFNSPHRQSYDTFLSTKLKTRFENWLKERLGVLRENNVISFDHDVKIHSVDSKISDGITEEFCRKNSLDYSSEIFLEIDLHGTKRFHLGRVPILRDNGSFIVNGKERLAVAQLTWSPGMFVSVTRYGVQIQLRPEKGVWIKFLLPDEETEKAKLSATDFPIKVYLFSKGKNVPFGNFLRSIGFEKGDLEELFKGFDSFKKIFRETGQEIFWGDDYRRVMDDRYRPTFIPRLMNIPEEETERKTDEEIWRYNERKLLEENSMGNLGRWQINRKLRRLSGYERYNEQGNTLTKADVKLALRYLMQFSDNVKSPPLDDPWDLSSLKCNLIGDFLENTLKWYLHKLKLGLEKKIEKYREKHIGQSIDKNTFLNMLDDTNGSYEDIESDALTIEENTDKETTFTNVFKKFFTTSDLTRIVLDDNELTAVGLTRRITYKGKGGIDMERNEEGRQMHWSHYGRICPLDTPENVDIGITLSLASYARINDNLGIIETPYYKVTWDNGKCTISNQEEYLSSHAEEILSNKKEKLWIAYADEKDKLKSEKKVLAHRGVEHFVEVESKRVAYIDISEDQQLGIAARLIPFIQHNDGARATMACNMMRQALPLKARELPLVTTGFEKEIFKNGGFGLGHTKDNAISYGINLLTMYIPWKGYNFEDAIVISESARDKLISVEGYKECYRIPLETDSEKTVKFKERLQDLKNIDGFFNRYDENGFITVGSYVRGGDPLIIRFKLGKRTTHELLTSFLDESYHTFFDNRYILSRGKEGEIRKVECTELKNGYAIYIEIERERIPQRGDKLANRHGHKGIISKIIPDHEMPYFIDEQRGHNHEEPDSTNHKHEETRRHSHAEILINPLSVISRMNLGQLHETLLGWTVLRSGKDEEKIPSFQNKPLTGLKTRLKKSTEGLEIDNSLKVKVYDPQGHFDIDSHVFAGYSYIMRLDHNAEEKEHARDMESFSYSYLTEQAMKGKKNKGGQRFGEMEVWALMAHNTPALLQEIMTLKSDNPDGRQKLYELLLGIITNEAEVGSSLPDALYTFSVFSICMGIKPVFYDNNNNPFTLLDEDKGFGRDLTPESIKGIEFRLLDDDDIEKWSFGEITIPEVGDKYGDEGIFSQHIFGPVQDYTCKCLQYKGYSPIASGSLRKSADGSTHVLPANFVCEKCQTPLIERKMRRKRIGYIKLSHPVVNILFYPHVALLLGLRENELKSILKNSPSFNFKTEAEAKVLFEIAFSACQSFKQAVIEKFVNNNIHHIMEKLKGMSGISSVISGIMKRVIRDEGVSGVGFVKDLLIYIDGDRKKILERLTLIEQEFIDKGTKGGEKNAQRIRGRINVIEFMLGKTQSVRQFLINDIPVIPPGLRPVYATNKYNDILGDVNEHYLKIIRQNNILKRFPEDPVALIAREEVRKLQECVNSFIWNDKAWKKQYTRDGRRPLKSIVTFFEGKEGFFKANLLGKRIDYSARAVIVPDPESLTIDQCGLSFKTMVKIFKPMLTSRLIEQSVAKGSNISINDTIRVIDDLLCNYPDLDNEDKELYQLVVETIQSLQSEYPVILNRQPTLHRLNMLAFFPELTDDSVFVIHPLITTGFNADFDGDQMAAYLPLSKEARGEVKRLLAQNNIFKPANGNLILNISQDIVLGMYYLTMTEEGRGRFHEIFSMKVDNSLNKKNLIEALEGPLVNADDKERVEIIEKLKKESFKQATCSGLSCSIIDFADLSKISNKVDVENATKSLDEKNPLKLILDSGARGDIDVFKQLVGKTEGGNLVNGRSIGKFFSANFVSRKNLVQNKLGTAKAGGMTKQLVHYAQHLIISEDDCNTSQGIRISNKIYKYYVLFLFDDDDIEIIQSPELQEEHGIPGKIIGYCFKDIDNEWQIRDNLDNASELTEYIGNRIFVKLEIEIIPDVVRNSRLYGRILAEDIGNYKRGDFIGRKASIELTDYIFNNEGNVIIRSPLTCGSDGGICRKCYGIDLGKGRPESVEDKYIIGLQEKVGIIAAHSISEPTTQMILSKKHAVTEGADADDDLSLFFEARGFFYGKNLIWYIPYLRNDDICRVDTIDDIYRTAGINVSIVHFEVMIKTIIERMLSYIGNPLFSCDYRNMLADASFENGINTLIKWAVEGQKDSIAGLKEKVIFGKRIDEGF
jgi:DNA-directed RNA polymerase beta subunit/DNA-directed RNA polymerase beta' subunit